MQKVAKNKNEKTNIEHVSFITIIEMYDCSLRRLGEECQLECELKAQFTDY